MTSYTDTALTVLVLEDEESCREMTRNILHVAGFRVHCARDFNEAIELIENGTRIDVAIVDVVMAVGAPHGICFARMAKLRRPSLKIVFMSGRMRAEDTKEFDEEDAFLRKPFAAHLLLDTVLRAA